MPVTEWEIGKLHLRPALVWAMALSSLKVRLARAMLTTLTIATATAFMMYLLTMARKEDAAATDRQSWTLMLVLSLVVASAGVLNAMLMSVFERVKEIGMMRALGMRDSEVICSFMLEGGFIGFLGAVLGIFFGLIIDLYLVYHGWDLSFARDMDIGYRIMKVMRGAWDFKAYIFAFLFSIIVPAIISIYPSRKAIKMEITQALRSA